MIGKTLAHYEITGLLGQGGMGEVYRAEDTKLKRDVAIKVLPHEMSGDPERTARFQREAQTLASLQHPNVASIYGYEDADGVRFLVMEIVEGEDLGTRLQRGPLAVEDAVDTARQIALGLEAAHARGIVHRDLKPANVMVDADAQVKILDFGLARAYTGDPGSETDLENSPTITAAMTQAGTILGTAAYMSPEQARGRNVDHRADIWAFGVVLFEMLTGRRAFEGETTSDTLAAVLRADVLWEQLPGDLPPRLRHLLERCLDRDPSRRLQSIAEARIALEDVKEGDTGAASDPRTYTGSGASRRERLAWTVLTLGLLAALGFLWLRPDPDPPRQLIYSTLRPPPDTGFGAAAPPAISPDGTRIAFVAAKEDASGDDLTLFVRDLAKPQAQEIASVGRYAFPFWSPDGAWIAYVSDGKLNKIASDGGPVVPICDAENGRGGSWNAEGTILFQAVWSDGLMAVPAGGGRPTPATTFAEGSLDVSHRWPVFLPDGRRFLFYVVNTTRRAPSEHSGIYLGSLDSPETRFLLASESRAVYANGHLLYRSGSNLMAHPIDLTSMEFEGDPIPIATGIPGGGISWGGANFDVSKSGLLVHLNSQRGTFNLLNWRDHAGNLLGSVGETGEYSEPELSHDGTKVAVSRGNDSSNIWIYDLERGAWSRLTSNPAEDRAPQWSADDSRLAFNSNRSGTGEVYIRAASGQGDAERVFSLDRNVVLSDWGGDDRYLLFSALEPGDNGWDVWCYDFETNEARAVIQGPFMQSAATLSPDGTLLAYGGTDSGASEIYVQTFPQSSGRWVVSRGTNNFAPAFSRDGRRLYYYGTRHLYVVEIGEGTPPSFSEPVILLEDVEFQTGMGRGYSLHPDGERILTNELPPPDPNDLGATLIQNWTELLRN